MLRFFLLIVLLVALIIGLTAGYGTTLPRDHVASSRIALAQPQEAVWDVIRNPAALIDTWPDLTRAEKLPDPAGREVWSETVDGFEMRLMITEARPPVRMVTTIDAGPEAQFGGRWVYELGPAPGGGTQVTVTEEGWVSNPVFRVMGRFLGQHRTIDSYLRALAQHFSEVVRPEHLGA